MGHAMYMQFTLATQPISYKLIILLTQIPRAQVRAGGASSDLWHVRFV